MDETCPLCKGGRGGGGRRPPPNHQRRIYKSNFKTKVTSAPAPRQPRPRARPAPWAAGSGAQRRDLRPICTGLGRDVRPVCTGRGGVEWGWWWWWWRGRGAPLLRGARTPRAAARARGAAPRPPPPPARDAGRVQLVRRDGRDVSTLYGREGGGERRALSARRRWRGARSARGVAGGGRVGGRRGEGERDVSG